MCVRLEEKESREGFGNRWRCLFKYPCRMRLRVTRTRLARQEQPAHAHARKVAPLHLTIVGGR